MQKWKYLGFYRLKISLCGGGHGLLHDWQLIFVTVLTVVSAYSCYLLSFVVDPLPL